MFSLGWLGGYWLGGTERLCEPKGMCASYRSAPEEAGDRVSSLVVSRMRQPG